MNKPFIPEKYLEQYTCPACGYHLAIAFYDGGQQPLATLGWPQSKDEAENMERLPLDFVRCLNCGHIYNAKFDYHKVPYVKNPNLMYNASPLWQKHLKSVANLILEAVPAEATILEIGCGEGQLLKLMAQENPQGKYIGFDPNTSQKISLPEIQIFQAYFQPEHHLKSFKPDMIISRHVLEHLMNPLAFLQRLVFFLNYYKISSQLFIEVPCIDKAIAYHRLEDFYYEHNSHFTRQSFQHLLAQVSSSIHLMATAYGDEVIFGLTQLSENQTMVTFAHEAFDFFQNAHAVKASIQNALKNLLKTRPTIALWGGTGKSSAFINFFDVSETKIPLVVDSDESKVGTYVPGTGQKICAKTELLSSPVDIILITTQWRIRDIVNEIEATGIPYQKILFEHQGQLVNYYQDQHPY